MAKVYRYRGHRILDCAWAGDPHGGRWYVQSYHESGMQWADEATPHHRTLAEAKEYIGEAIEIIDWIREGGFIFKKGQVMADSQLENLGDIAERSIGLRYDSAEAQTIHDEGDWSQYYPEVDGYGYLTGRVIDSDDDGFLVVDDWAMVEASTLSKEELRHVDEGWFPIWKEDK